MIRLPINRFRSHLLNRMVLRPSSHRIDHGDQTRVVWQSRGGPLEAFFRNSDPPTETPDLVILKFPGTAGRGERSTSFPANFLDARDVHVWTWNPPGYGQSAGRASLASIAEAAVDFCDYVSQSYDQPHDQLGRPRPPVWMVGNSLGCATALNAAANSDHKPSGMLLRNPPPLELVVLHVARKYPFGRFVQSVADRLAPAMNVLHTAPMVNVPALFVQSELDTLVLPEMQSMVRDAYAGPQWLVELKGIGHDGLIDDEHYLPVRRGLDWLCEQTGV